MRRPLRLFYTLTGIALYVILALTLTVAAPASAAPVGLYFEGDLVFSTTSDISSGDTIRGGIVFNSSTPDALADSTQAFYASPGAFAFEAGSFARAGLLNWIWVYDNYGNTPSDQFRADAYDGVDATWYWFRLDLFAEGVTSALSSDMLPTGGLDYQSFGVHRIEIQTNNGAASFDISRLHIFNVPEPSTYALMLAGLAAIGFAVRRRCMASVQAYGVLLSYRACAGPMRAVSTSSTMAR